MEWIARHSVGWQYLLPAIFVSSLALSAVLRSPRRALALWATLVPWGVSVAVLYLVSGFDSARHVPYLFWFALTATLLVVSIIPFLAVAFYLRSGYALRQSPTVAVTLATLFGVVSIPLAGLLSGMIAQSLIPIIVPG